MTYVKKGIVKDAAFYASIGRKGGNRTKRTMLDRDPDYYRNIGLKGGESMKKSHGKAFYSKIGKLGHRTKVEKRLHKGEYA